jgi:hypothetical protein
MLRKEGRNDFLALGVYRSSKFCEKSALQSMGKKCE